MGRGVADCNSAAMDIAEAIRSRNHFGRICPELWSLSPWRSRFGSIYPHFKRGDRSHGPDNSDICRDRGMLMEPVGTPWWLERLNRRKANLRIAQIGTVGGFLALAGGKLVCDAADDDVEVRSDALELQKSQGWDVG